MTAVQCTPKDRDRLNDLATLLTRSGIGGKFGQAETIRYLLDQREAELRLEDGPPSGNNERTGIAWSE